MDGGVRGFDLARNPGLSNNTEYGAGEFPLPTRPSARSTDQSSSKLPSMTRAQQTTEAYPDLGVLKKELEKTQRQTSIGIRQSWTGKRLSLKGTRRSSNEIRL